MKTHFFFIAAVVFATTFFVLQKATAQNVSPFWSAQGNNNATSSSKLGTTNNINLGSLYKQRKAHNHKCC